MTQKYIGGRGLRSLRLLITTERQLRSVRINPVRVDDQEEALKIGLIKMHSKSRGERDKLWLTKSKRGLFFSWTFFFFFLPRGLGTAFYVVECI